MARIRLSEAQSYFVAITIQLLFFTTEITGKFAAFPSLCGLPRTLPAHDELSESTGY